MSGPGSSGGESGIAALKTMYSGTEAKTSRIKDEFTDPAGLLCNGVGRLFI
jgi:hypothetical protein